MKIIEKQSKWFRYLFCFDYNPQVVDFCRYIKNKYGFDMFNFVKEKELVGWGFNDAKIMEEIVIKFPATIIEITNKPNTILDNLIKTEEPINLDEGLKLFTKLDLYPYQKAGVSFFEKVNGVGMLADEMRLGKSCQAIAYAQKNNFKTLVVCPSSIKTVWRGEIEKFTDKTWLLINAKDLKKDISTKGYDFIILNYEIVGKAITKIDFRDIDLIVADESFYIKNQKSLRFKSIKKLNFISHRLCLTGTPILNRPSELWSQLNFIDPLIWNNWWKFAMRYCGAEKTQWGWDFSGRSNLEELKKRLSVFMLRRLCKDVFSELPPKIETIIKIQMSDKEWKEYNRLYDEFEDLIQNSENRTVQLARLTYLKQWLSLNKIENAIEIINNIIENGEKVVVFSQYLQPLRILKDKLGDIAVVYEGKMSVEEKDIAKTLFQTNPNIKVFLGSITTAGYGIKLSSASTIIMLDLIWSPALISQATARIVDTQQKTNNNIYYLIHENTIEQSIFELLKFKMDTISTLQNEEKLISIKEESIITEFLDKIKNK